MSPEDTKPTRHRHPMKLIAIVLLWILALYLALLVLKNNERESSTLESSRPHIQKSQKMCQSPECITLAHQLHNWQDISVDPCQDFYQAACGKYIEHTTVPNTRFGTTNIIIKQLLKEYLVKNVSRTSKSENAMKLYHQKCEESKLMNANQTKQEIVQEISRKLLEIAPQMINIGRNETDFDLNDILSNMASLGVTNFGLFDVIFIGSSDLFISFDNAMTKLNSNLYYLQTYDKQFVLDVFEKVGFRDENETDSNNLRNLLHSKMKPLNLEKKEVGLAELHKNLPSVDFERIIKNLANPSRKSKVWKLVSNKVTASKDSFIFSKPLNLESVLRTTSKKTIASFVVTSFIINEISRASKDMKSKDSCIEEVIKWFPLAAIRVIVRNHFDKENLELASQMVEDIRQSFVETIHESTWLQNDTKMKALRKVEKMKKVVGYPKEFEVPGALDSFFDSLELSTNDSLLGLRTKANRFETELLLDLQASIIPMMSTSEYFDANAEYRPAVNGLFIYVPFLHGPRFDSTYPSYARVASIGEVIGHEIGHGFDPNGRHYDENGKKNNWWTPEDSAEYDKKAQCLVEQYNNHDDPDFGKNLNGSVTIDEMVADIIGINLSWKTYKKLDLSREPALIGFEDYSKDKLFFRVSALNWCKARSTNSLAEQLTKVHATSSFRVNGVFSNMKSFAEAYNCPVGSPMNPVKKCELF